MVWREPLPQSLRCRPGSVALEGHLPSFDGAAGWLNSPPLAAADLRGKVVLVDFWTYTCINWLRTLSYVRAWAKKYEDHGLVVVGVHTPEFPFERDVKNVRWAVKDMSVKYPVALDSDYAIWDAFANRYWPAVYIPDAQGRIRHHQFGEGGYEECERIIQRFLREAERGRIGDDLVSVAGDGFEAQADWANLESPETYLGYEEAQNFASPGGAKAGQPRTYAAPGAGEAAGDRVRGVGHLSPACSKLRRGMITADAPALLYSSAPGRWVPAITVLSSGNAPSCPGTDCTMSCWRSCDLSSPPGQRR